MREFHGGAIQVAITQTRSGSVRQSRGGLLASAGAAVAVASFLGLLIGVLTSTAFPTLADPSSGTPFLMGGALLSAVHAIVLGGVAALATSGAIRTGPLKYVAFA